MGGRVKVSKFRGLDQGEIYHETEMWVKSCLYSLAECGRDKSPVKGVH